MNEKLQDLAWSVLPKKFKEEVKKKYAHYEKVRKEEEELAFADGAAFRLSEIFGTHNLTSDAEIESKYYFVSYISTDNNTHRFGHCLIKSRNSSNLSELAQAVQRRNNFETVPVIISLNILTRDEYEILNGEGK